MDFVTEFSRLLQRAPQPQKLEPQALAVLMEVAAANTLASAAHGEPVCDVLSLNQLGAITAALHWNFSPQVRKAVKINGEEKKA
jgi:hypothetical protein